MAHAKTPWNKNRYSQGRIGLAIGYIHTVLFFVILFTGEYLYYLLLNEYLFIWPLYLFINTKKKKMYLYLFFGFNSFIFIKHFKTKAIKNRQNYKYDEY
jgi:hypothetical protein